MNNYNDIKTREQRMSKFKEPNFLQATLEFFGIMAIVGLLWLYLIALN